MATIEDQREKARFQFEEAIYPDVVVSIDLKNILASDLSEFQKIEVIETSFGKTLVTDGKTQSTQMDERSYHESLVHPAMLKYAMSTSSDSSKSNSGPRSVFIGGGGELATAREVLRHKSVERVLMVDLDEKVIEVCKEFLPEWGGERVTNDPRFELVIGDAYAYLDNCTEKFDVMIMDISDPIEAGPGIMLYTQEFYQHIVKSLLNENGVFITQSGIADGIHPESGKDGTSFAAIHNTLKASFDYAIPYSINIPSFGSDWGYIMAGDWGHGDSRLNDSKSNNGANADVDSFVSIKPNVIDDMISRMITDLDGANSNGSACKKNEDVLTYYDGISHLRMFALPKPLRYMLKKDQRIMTKENPVFMY